MSIHWSLRIKSSQNHNYKIGQSPRITIQTLQAYLVDVVFAGFLKCTLKKSKYYDVSNELVLWLGGQTLKLYKKCKMRCIGFLKSKGYSLNIYVSFRLTNKAYLSLAQDQYEGLSEDQIHYTVIMVWWTILLTITL